jgi:ribokinase
MRSARLLLLQLEVPLDTVEYALDVAQHLGIPAILNAAPARPLTDMLLHKVSCLVVNETEATLLSECPVRDLDSAEEAAQRLRRRGVPAVIVTMGRRGAVVAGEDCFTIPARSVPVVDTTAAGDAFVGALAVSRVERPGWSQLDLRAAARFAVSAGTLAVTHFGAQTSLPLREEVESFDRLSLPA